MKERNILITIIAIICILLTGLVESEKESQKEDLDNKWKCSIHDHKEIVPLNIISGKLDKKDYKEPGKFYVFAKNLLEDNNSSTSSNTSDVIVTEGDYTFYYNCIFTCSYLENKQNRKKESAKHLDRSSKEIKRILMVPHGVWCRETLMARIKEAEAHSTDLRKALLIKLAIYFMERVLNRMICQVYIDDFIYSTNKVKEDKVKILEKTNLCNTTAYELLRRKKLYNKQRDTNNLLKLMDSNKKAINKILETNQIVDKITKNTIKENEREFMEENQRIAKEKKNRKNLKYNNKYVEHLEFYDEIAACINIITNKKLDDHTYINTKKIKSDFKEQLEEKDIVINEILNRLEECFSMYATVKNLREEINKNIYVQINKKKEIVSLEEKEDIETVYNMNIGIKDIDILQKALKQLKKNNDLLSHIVSSKKADIIIDAGDLKKEANAWNRHLVDLLVMDKMSYYRFNGRDQDINSKAIARNKISFCTIQTTRNDEYSRYKNITMLKEMFENGFVEIRKILEESQQRTIAEENKKIIELLVDIATDYIALDNPKELNKKKEAQEEIKGVLSEIEDEFVKDTDPDAIDESIQKKKQSVVNLLFKKLDKSEYEDAVEMEKLIREIAEGVVNVLVDRIVDREKYKGFSAVKNEILIDEEYIRSQYSESMLKYLTEFTERNQYTHSGIISTCNAYFSSNFFNLVGNTLKQNNSIDWLLEDITDLKIGSISTMLCIANDIYNSINTLKFYNEIWKNPVFLVLENSNTSPLSKQKRKAYIYHRLSEKNINQHRKEVNFTNFNLNAFMHAKTLQDIKDIGTTKSKMIKALSRFSIIKRKQK